MIQHCGILSFLLSISICEVYFQTEQEVRLITQFNLVHCVYCLDRRPAHHEYNWNCHWTVDRVDGTPHTMFGLNSAAGICALLTFVPFAL